MQRDIRSVAITGPTGAIGLALIDCCTDAGIDVTAICHRGSARKERIPDTGGVKIVEADLSEFADAAELAYNFGECDAFFHFAWNATIGDGRNDMKLQTSNIEYALDAVGLASAMGAKVFIGAGSQAEYGRVSGKLTATTPAFPENGYGMAKLCAGQMTRTMAHQMNMEHIWPRILSVYGPGDGSRTMISSVIRTLFEGNLPKLTAGEQQWDYLFSKDAARAMLLMAEKGIDGKVYCLGSGEARPLREYVEVLRDGINPELELGFGEVPYGPGQVMHLQADITELSQDTGFSPEYSFQDGICETIEWMKKEQEKSR